MGGREGRGLLDRRRSSITTITQARRAIVINHSCISISAALRQQGGRNDVIRRRRILLGLDQLDQPLRTSYLTDGRFWFGASSNILRDDPLIRSASAALISFLAIISTLLLLTNHLPAMLLLTTFPRTLLFLAFLAVVVGAARSPIDNLCEQRTDLHCEQPRRCID